MTTTPTPRPLEGLVVVAVEQAVAAPLTTRQLADLGARVLKIERPGGGDFARGYDDTVHGMSSAFLWLNRGKESVELDLKSPEGREVLERLLAQADVFVQNLSPSAAQRAGLDPAAVQRRHPHVIACAITGYGTTGPLASAKAYDLLIQGEAGLISLTGDGDVMAKVGISIADISAGSQCCTGILAALRHRDHTGQALPVDIAMFDTLAEWLAYPLYYADYGGTEPARTGARHATIVPYGSFPAADGLVLLAVQNDREWRRFCETVLERPDLADDPRFDSHATRMEHREELEALIIARLSPMPVADVQALLTKADIAQARLNSIADLAEHEQITTRNRWVPTPSPVGTVRTLLPPWLPTAPDGTPPELGAVPAPGEHTTQVLAWLDTINPTAEEA
ncbi:CaiB/BaiF CoA transferase family protein [Ornithinimicrobium cavernae]|uniref:CaiB/BaiF CoA transferase family protein n=1 Tax=Ornithinimicrobium cavernae TaxID=2666047 RepID=UPI000D698311|nr:CaiB/BaiF CoA-transferase family protein [Ornithinimicrobium cavernae]